MASQVHLAPCPVPFHCVEGIMEALENLRLAEDAMEDDGSMDGATRLA